jgi:hypothetical protein
LFLSLLLLPLLWLLLMLLMPLLVMRLVQCQAPAEREQLLELGPKGHTHYAAPH